MMRLVIYMKTRSWDSYLSKCASVYFIAFMITCIAARHFISKFVRLFFFSKKLLSSRVCFNTIAQSSLNQILEFHQAVSTSDKSECIGKQDRISPIIRHL